MNSRHLLTLLVCTLIITYPFVLSSGVTLVVDELMVKSGIQKNIDLSLTIPGDGPPVTWIYTWSHNRNAWHLKVTCPAERAVLYNSLPHTGNSDPCYLFTLGLPCEEEVIRDLTSQINIYASDCYREDPKYCYIDFVQQCVRYTSDMEAHNQTDWATYPVETLILGAGDCEDSTLLLAEMLRQNGYETALLRFESHIAVGIRDETGGLVIDSWTVVETTNKCPVERIPRDLSLYRYLSRVEVVGIG